MTTQYHLSAAPNGGSASVRGCGQSDGKWVAGHWLGKLSQPRCWTWRRFCSAHDEQK